MWEYTCILIYNVDPYITVLSAFIEILTIPFNGVFQLNWMLGKIYHHQESKKLFFIELTRVGMYDYDIINYTSIFYTRVRQ